MNTESSERPPLEEMSLAIAHRGPDDFGQWEEAGVGLGHRRLSVIDLSPTGHQPMASNCGRYVIVFNGEIYNYLELRRELEALGERFLSASDTEVLLVAWRRWGRGCLPRLNGMWAFAIWDRQERALIASRDRFGKKPLYYACQRGRFLFASEIKALLASDMVRAVPDPAAVADFAAERVSDHGENTFFRNVFQLRPGHSLEWRTNRCTVSCFWSVRALPEARHEPLRQGELLALLKDAVSLRLRSDVPVGTLLSGGIDSSLITAIAASQLPERTQLHVFTTVNDPPEEEAKGVELLARSYPSISVHEDQPRAEHFWNELDACLWHQEEPFADASMVAHFRLMRLARATGIKVLLTGQGADEVFAGYPGYMAVYLGGLINRWRFRMFRRTWTQARHANSASCASTALYALPNQWVVAVRRARALRSIDWLAEDYRRVSPELHEMDTSVKGTDPLDATMVESIRARTLPGFLHYEDRNSMAFGVETRLPFLDYRLVERLFACPTAAKLADGVTKSLLRQTGAGVVPSATLRRSRKTGYPAPLSAWLRNSCGQLRDRAEANIKNCPLIEHKIWERHLQAFLGGNNRGLIPVWRGFVLALWYERFIRVSA